MAGNLTAMIAAAFSGSAAPPVTSDPYFEYTTLLLPGNGTNGAQNNTFLDGSTNNFTITRNGNTTQGTFSPFSQTGWGNYFDGTGDYLTTSNSAGFASGTNNITIEWWMYPTTLASTQYLFDTRDPASGSSAGILIGLSTAGKFFVYIGGNLVADPFNTVISTNTWTHIALVRNSNSWKLFVNGTADSVNPTSSASMTQQYCTIATSALNRDTSSTNKFNGYLSNIRFVNNRAVYSSNFTPPTSPLTRTSGGSDPPQGSETILLTSQSNSFLDSNGVNTPASSPLTITANGTTSVVAFSPFNPSASWSAATYGGSGYFDGSGDYLTVPANSAWNLGSGSFCIECWSYPTATQSDRHLFSLNSSGGTGYWVLRYNTGTVPQFIYNNYATSLTSSKAAVINAWNHIAMVSNGTTMSLYLNGERVATASATSINDGSANPLLIGTQLNVSSREISGYLTDGRVVKGSAVYDPSSSTITVPTAPLTAITNTSLLLNFTNAGIYDATSKNDLETVGNAQISTTQSKWGGSSMSFDGTGDYLTNNNASNPLLSFGTGDFTIECWTYFTNTANKGVFQISTTAGGLQANQTNTLAVSYDSSSAEWRFYAKNTGITGAGTNPLNAWVHIALVRSGTTTTLYVNGTNTISTTSDTTNYTGTYLCVGGYYSTAYLFIGYIQDLRITKGYARYTSNFTAPTAAFPTL